MIVRWLCVLMRHREFVALDRLDSGLISSIQLLLSDFEILSEHGV